jgi:hypothetical protein
VAACGKDSGTNPLPNIGGGSSSMSAVASAYVDTAVAFTRDVWYWSDTKNWAQVRTAVRGRTPNAQTTAQTYPAIEYMVDSIIAPQPDLHTGFWRPDVAPGRVNAPASDTRAIAQGQALALPAAPRQAAYLWMPSFTGTNDVGRADSIQTVIRTLDAATPCGWIIDLRRNPGGAWAAMIAGLSPILGDAPASAAAPGLGGFVERSGARVNYTLQGGGAGIYVPAQPGQSRDTTLIFTRVTAPYTLRRPNLPVALLQGGSTASAGEIIVFSFRGTGMPTRTFGDSTYGVTTQPYGIYLRPDSAFLNVTAAVMFDRTGQRWGGKIGPDERIVGAGVIAARDLTPTPQAGDAVLDAARAWMAARPECTGAVTTEGPARARAPQGPVTQPGEARPLSVPVDHVSRWLVGPRRID